jgi:hypothetical protein
MEEAKRFIRKMRAKLKELRATPGAMDKFMIKGGFITKSGKLPKRYGGQG